MLKKGKIKIKKWQVYEVHVFDEHTYYLFRLLTMSEGTFARNLNPSLPLPFITRIYSHPTSKHHTIPCYHQVDLPTRKAMPVAKPAAKIPTTCCRIPRIPRLVKMANIPPAGVKPPYIKDWNPAAREPITPVILSVLVIGKSDTKRC